MKKKTLVLLIMCLVTVTVCDFTCVVTMAWSGSGAGAWAESGSKIGSGAGGRVGAWAKTGVAPGTWLGSGAGAWSGAGSGAGAESGSEIGTWAEVGAWTDYDVEYEAENWDDASISAESEVGVATEGDGDGEDGTEATAMTDAQICSELGVLRGRGEGVTESYLAEFTTREQAAYLTLRLMGKEVEARSYAGHSGFTDTQEMAYADGRRMLSYLKNHPEFGWQGDENGHMNPGMYVTAQAMYKVALTVLGYKVGEDFLWENTLTYAREKGIGSLWAKWSYLTNNDIATIMVETLKANLKDQEVPLFEHLIELEVIDSQKAYSVFKIPESSEVERMDSSNGDDNGDGDADAGANNNGVNDEKEEDKGEKETPLISETTADLTTLQVVIRFNVILNPTYAKSLKNYEYYVAGKGYIPLPISCITRMPDETTVVIQFPEKGWSEGDVAPKEAFTKYIATDGKAEIKISGLLDVDGNELEDIFIDVPRR